MHTHICTVTVETKAQDQVNGETIHRLAARALVRDLEHCLTQPLDARYTKSYAMYRCPLKVESTLFSFIKVLSARLLMH